MFKKLFVFIAMSAMAQYSAAEELAVAGVGAQKCGDWVAARSRPNQRQIQHLYIFWLQGYLSGVNMSSFMTSNKWSFNIPPAEVLEILLDKQCTKDPLQMVVMASVHIQRELVDRNPMSE